jgi:hypothetical protein
VTFEAGEAVVQGWGRKCDYRMLPQEKGAGTQQRRGLLEMATAR